MGQEKLKEALGIPLFSPFDRVIQSLSFEINKVNFQCPTDCQTLFFLFSFNNLY